MKPPVVAARNATSRLRPDFRSSATLPACAERLLQRQLYGEALKQVELHRDRRCRTPGFEVRQEPGHCYTVAFKIWRAGVRHVSTRTLPTCERPIARRPKGAGSRTGHVGSRHAGTDPSRSRHRLSERGRQQPPIRGGEDAARRADRTGARA